MIRIKLHFYISILALLLFSNFVFAQLPERVHPSENPVQNPTNMMVGAFIDVNAATYTQSSYTAEQLIKQVLMSGNGGCASPQVFNVVVSPNVAATNTNRQYGYFNKGTTAFPFTDGVVLSSGYAKNAGNSINAGSDPISSSNHDADLATALGVSNSSLNDATFIQFDFIPTSTQMKFNYLLASNEYTSYYPCSYADGFALLLKKVSDPTYTNIAVLPNSTPVSITNIHPAITGPISCPAINQTYFAGYNTASNITNFKGRTIPLTAQATVIPGVTYRIKMVVADYLDQYVDSAVFIEGGSFNIGVTLAGPGGVALPASLIMCDNTPQTLVAQVDPAAGITFQWFLNGVAIPGATANTYTATSAGTYSVNVVVPGNPCPGTAQVVITQGHFPVVQDASLVACYTTGNATFNLTQANSSISATPGVTYSYYLNQADALAGNTNTIANPTAFSSAGQTVYVRVLNGTCAKVAALKLYINNKTTATVTGSPNVINCNTPTSTLTATLQSTASAFPPPSGLGTTTYSWVASAGGHIVSGANTLTPVVDAAGNYTLTITDTFSNTTCTSTAMYSLVSDFTPPTIAVTAAKTSICLGESLLLTATGAVTYSWSGLSGNTDHQVITPTSAGTFTYSVNGIGTNGCASTTPGTITITVVPAIVSTLQGGIICAGDKITLDAGAGPNYTYLWNNGETSQTIVADTPGIYTVKIDNGVCFNSFSTEVVGAVVPVISGITYDNGTLAVNASTPNGNLEYSINGGTTWQNSNIFYNILKNTQVQILIRVKTTTCVTAIDYFTFVMQNVITPNNDGVNDVIDLRGIANYSDFAGSIYDRYGKQIFKADKTNTRWDGYFQGKKLPTATYWYQLHWNDPVNKQPIDQTGWIMLKNRE